MTNVNDNVGVGVNVVCRNLKLGTLFLHVCTGDSSIKCTEQSIVLRTFVQEIIVSNVKTNNSVVYCDGCIYIYMEKSVSFV